MAGTISGGAKAAATNKRLYGENYYRRIGAMHHASWVANGRKPRGFSLDRKRASEAGRIGGHISKRRPQPKPEPPHSFSKKLLKLLKLGV